MIIQSINFLFDHVRSAFATYLVVEPTHLKNMFVKLDHFPKVQGGHKNIWNRHLVFQWFWSKQKHDEHVYVGWGNMFETIWLAGVLVKKVVFKRFPPSPPHTKNLSDFSKTDIWIIWCCQGISLFFCFRFITWAWNWENIEQSRWSRLNPIPHNGGPHATCCFASLSPRRRQPRVKMVVIVLDSWVNTKQFGYYSKKDLGDKRCVCCWEDFGRCGHRVYSKDVL